MIFGSNLIRGEELYELYGVFGFRYVSAVAYLRNPPPTEINRNADRQTPKICIWPRDKHTRNDRS